MSYKDRVHDVAETFIENRPDALLKPIMGKLFGGNAPGYQTDDKYLCGFQRWRERELSLKGQSLQRVIAKYSNVIANEVRDSRAVAN